MSTFVKPPLPAALCEKLQAHAASEYWLGAAIARQESESELRKLREARTKDAAGLMAQLQARDAELLRAVADWLGDKDDCIAPGPLAMAADELRKAAEQP